MSVRMAAPLRRALFALWLVIGTVSIGTQPAGASLLSFLAGGGAKVAEKATVRASRTGLTLTEHAAIAAAALSSAGAAAYLTGTGNDLLLYLAGSHSPLRMLSAAADWSVDIGSKLKAGDKLVIDSSIATRLGPQTRSLADRYQLAIDDPHSGIKQVIRFDAKSVRYLVEIRPGLAVPLEAAEMPEDVWAMLSTQPPLEKIRLMAMIADGDPDALARALKVGGDRIDMFKAGAASSRASLDAYHDGVVIMVGHADADAFVLRYPGDVSVRVPFDEIEAEAARVNATVLYVGCETFGTTTGSGYLRALLDTEVAVGLRQALSAKTYSELLAGLATPGNPFIINPEALRREAGRLFLSTQRLSEHEALVNRGAVGARLSSKIITTARDVDSLATVLAVLYAVGLIPALFMLELSWDCYSRMFPILPNQVLRPMAFRVAYAAELLLFTVLLPISAMWVMIFVFLGGGWSKREDFLTFFWSLFLRPTKFTATLILMTFIIIVRLGIFIIGFVPILISLFLLLDWSASASVASGVTGFLLAGVGICVLVLMWRLKPMNMTERLVNLVIARFDNLLARSAVLALPALAVTALVAIGAMK